MSSNQFKKWAIYEGLEPFEEERADWRSAQLVTTLVNVHRKRGTRAKSPKDFFIKFDKGFAGGQVCAAVHEGLRWFRRSGGLVAAVT